MATKSSLLKRLNKKWDNTRETVGDDNGAIEDIPTGNYLLTKPEAEVGEFKTSGKQAVMLTYTISEGDFEGKKIFTNIPLEEDWSLEQLAKWLNFMDNPIDDLSDLEDALEEITANEGFIFEAKVKVDENGYKKVYQKEVVEYGESDGGEKAEDDEEDGEDLDDLSRDELEKLAKELGLTVRKMKKLDDDELRDWIDAEQGGEEDDDESDSDSAEEEDGDEEEEDEEEETSKASSKRTTKKVVKKAAKKVVKKAAKKEDDEMDDKTLIKTLKGLCDNYGLPFKARDKAPQFKEHLEEFDWIADELSDDEVVAIKQLGLKAR